MFKIALTLLFGDISTATFFVSIQVIILLFSGYSSMVSKLDLIGIWSTAFIVSLVHELTIGIPIIIIFKTYGLDGWRGSIIGGFLIGSVPSAIVTINKMNNLEALSILRVSEMGLLGMIGGFAGWVCWTRFDSVNKFIEECRKS